VHKSSTRRSRNESRATKTHRDTETHGSSRPLRRYKTCTGCTVGPVMSATPRRGVSRGGASRKLMHLFDALMTTISAIGNINAPRELILRKRRTRLIDTHDACSYSLGISPKVKLVRVRREERGIKSSRLNVATEQPTKRTIPISEIHY